MIERDDRLAAKDTVGILIGTVRVWMIQSKTHISAQSLAHILRHRKTGGPSRESGLPLSRPEVDTIAPLANSPGGMMRDGAYERSIERNREEEARPASRDPEQAERQPSPMQTVGSELRTAAQLHDHLQILAIFRPSNHQPWLGAAGVHHLDELNGLYLLRGRKSESKRSTASRQPESRARVGQATRRSGSGWVAPNRRLCGDEARPRSSVSRRIRGTIDPDVAGDHRSQLSERRTVSRVSPLYGEIPRVGTWADSATCRLVNPPSRWLQGVVGHARQAHLPNRGLLSRQPPKRNGNLAGRRRGCEQASRPLRRRRGLAAAFGEAGPDGDEFIPD